MRSLRGRITLTAALVVAALLTVTSVGVVAVTRAALRASLDAQVAVAADSVAAQLTSGSETSELTVPFRADGPFAPPLVEVDTAEGTASVVLEGPFVQPFDPSPPLSPPPAPPGGTLRRTAEDGDWSLAIRGVRTSGGEVVVVAASPYAAVRSVTDPLVRGLGVAVPIVTLLAALLADRLVARSLRPVEAIRREAAAITESSLSRRVQVRDGNDEIGRLATTFNAMLERLDLGARRQRQFIADASHELRGPVASLTTALDVADAHPGSRSAPELAGALRADVAGLQRLVVDLLDLARQDDAQPPPGGDVDLDAVVDTEARRTWPRPVRVVRLDPVRVEGHAYDLGRAVANLLDNATRHARTGVEVSLRRHDDTAVLVVDDDGPGVPPAARERVFERFVRLDDARTRVASGPAGGGPGTGLGLALVRSIVTRHDGDVRLTDAPLGGARVRVTFPLQGASGGRR